MSFLSTLFPSKQSTPSPAPAPQGQGNQQQSPAGGNQQQQQQDPSASPGNPNQNVNGSNTQLDPSELWNKMWDNTNDGEKSKAPPQLSLDSEVLNQVSGKMDFLQGLDPSIMQKAQNGDSQALFDVIQHVGRASYRNALSHSGALTNEFVGQRDAYSSKNMPSLIRDELTNNLMAEGNQAPAYVRKQMQDLTKRIQQANPDASPKEVRELAQKYVKELSAFVNPGQETAQEGESSGPKQTNWDQWLS